MAHTVTGKLNKAASEFAAAESTGFGISLGEQNYNRKTKQKEWTNYDAAIFAKDPRQIDFYRSALVEGAIVSITGKGLIVDVFQGQNGPITKLIMCDSSLDYVGTPGAQQQTSRHPAQQATYAGSSVSGQQSAPQGGFDSFDEETFPF